MAGSAGSRHASRPLDPIFVHSPTGLFRVKLPIRFQFVLGDGERIHLHNKEDRRTISRKGESGRISLFFSGTISLMLPPIFVLR